MAPWLWRDFRHFANAKVDWWFKSTGEEKAKEKADEHRLVEFPVWYRAELGNRERAKRGVGQANQPIAEPAE